MDCIASPKKTNSTFGTWNIKAMNPGMSLNTELGDENVVIWKTTAIDVELQSRRVQIATLRKLGYQQLVS